MKPYMLIFLAVFLLLIGYVCVRGYQSLAQFSALKYTYAVVYILLFATMMTGFIGADYFPVKLANTLSFVGYTFFMFIVYMGLAFLLVDIFRIINHFFIHLDPAVMYSARLWANGIVFGLVVVALCVGNYKFNHPAVTELSVEAKASVLQNKQLKIVMVSDTHFGSSIGKKKAQQYVELINAQSPDIVFFVGDIADRSIEPFVKQELYEDLQQIKSTYGVFGVPGNHEYYSDNKERNYEYYEKAGIKMLFDDTVLIDSSFYVVGRDDKTNPNRKELAAIMQSLDKNLPAIMLDHQPFHLEEAEDNGVTLQFSGHVHNGQFFPGNLIVKSMYEVAYGYKQKGNTHYFVSSGLGIWGPKYRIGTKSELVVVNLSY